MSYSALLVLLAVISVAFSNAQTQYLVVSTTTGAVCGGDTLEYTRYTLGTCMPVTANVDYVAALSGTFSTVSTATNIYLKVNLFTDSACTASEFLETVDYDGVFATTCTHNNEITYSPSTSPTETPTNAPNSPTMVPTVSPTKTPTFTPTVKPSGSRSPTYSQNPTEEPTAAPTFSIKTLDDQDDDYVMEAHSTMAMITTETQDLVHTTGSFVMLGESDSPCGSTSDLYYYHWSVFNSYELICHEERNVFLQTVGVDTLLAASFSSGDTAPKKHRRCFAGSETVQLESGEFKQLSEVQLGEMVLSANANGDMRFSKVLALPHDRNTIAAKFTQLTTASGNDLKLSADHLISVNAGCDVTTKSELKYADDVAIGMCLVSASGLDAVVSSRKNVVSTGIYSLVTEEEFVVVNGFVASPFAGNHVVANAYYNVVRAFPFLGQLSLVREAGEIFNALVDASTN